MDDPVETVFDAVLLALAICGAFALAGLHVDLTRFLAFLLGALVYDLLVKPVLIPKDRT